jgi:hypothetical protein
MIVESADDSVDHSVEEVEEGERSLEDTGERGGGEMEQSEVEERGEGQGEGGSDEVVEESMEVVELMSAVVDGQPGASQLSQDCQVRLFVCLFVCVVLI